MEILSLVDNLEKTLASSARVPATQKVMVNLNRMLELVDQMRLAIPQDLQDAQDMLAQRESVLSQALLDARRIKASAEEASRNQVKESAIMAEAERKAEHMLADAKRRSDALLQDAQQGAHTLAQKAQSFGDTQVRESNRYAQEVLSRLETQLSAALNSIRLGLDSLESQEVRAPAPTD